ncbi:hypothetical protein CKO11_05005 [Rhodobacter sp. TJ_12]|uniref:hypothetical protein n=1 Tax=Rhodobacter sp. TJ_12 TaxID=2029399 RepID=UPI001CBE14B8|nr:hypothetical protein [Rhodobacter sp. TJ_12]MBZ4021818.1 hypothetical protein [Rhodobacter sp. TJ_12]
MFDLFDTPYDSTPEEDGKTPVILVGIDDLRHPELPVFAEGMADIDLEDQGDLTAKLRADPRLGKVLDILAAAQAETDAAVGLLGEDLSEEEMAVYEQLMGSGPTKAGWDDLVNGLGASVGTTGEDSAAKTPIAALSDKADYGLRVDAFDFGPFEASAAEDDAEDDKKDWPPLKQ